MPRFTTPQEVFDSLPARYAAAQAGNLNMVLQFDLTGEGGGQWNVVITAQQLAVHTGPATNPTATLGATAADYVALANGDLNPMQAFMQAKLKITGDMSAVIKLQSLMGR